MPKYDPDNQNVAFYGGSVDNFGKRYEKMKDAFLIGGQRSTLVLIPNLKFKHWTNSNL